MKNKPNVNIVDINQDNNEINIVWLYFEPISDSSSDYNGKMRSKQLYISKEWKTCTAVCCMVKLSTKVMSLTAEK